MSIDYERLHRLLGVPGGNRVRQRLREHLARGGQGPITLTRASDAERTIVERLLGRPPRRGQSLRVHPQDIDTTLRRAGIAPDLTAALEALDGPIRDPRAERAAESQRWEAVFKPVRERAQAQGLSDWVEALAASGLLKRLSRSNPRRGHDLLVASLDVLEQLPGQGINRASLAARWLGNAHGLDRGEPVAALVRQALHRHWRGGVADPKANDRTVWAHGGVLIGGDINSTVLTYRLPASDTSPTARMLEAVNIAGEPVYLTLRQLLRHPPRWDVAGREVFVCENPTVVAEAAERRGFDCAPLVATNGRPQTACLALLESLLAAGAQLRVRADLDWTGISIVNELHRRFPLAPWRMDHATLERYADLEGTPLQGQPVTAEWESDLTAALQRRGRALQEEQLLEALLADLARAPSKGCHDTT